MTSYGEVDPYLRPIMRFTLRGAFGAEETVEAHFDTGFTRALAVPYRVVELLGFMYIRDVKMTLADGRQEMFPEY